jgi:hypothetical protein
VLRWASSSAVRASPRTACLRLSLAPAHLPRVAGRPQGPLRPNQRAPRPLVWPHADSSPSTNRRRRREAPPVSNSPPHWLKLIHLDASVLHDHFPHRLAPSAHRILAIATGSRHGAPPLFFLVAGPPSRGQPTRWLGQAEANQPSGPKAQCLVRIYIQFKWKHSNRVPIFRNLSKFK